MASGRTRAAATGAINFQSRSYKTREASSGLEGRMGARILVIEDEENISDYLVTGLREEGYAVGHAADGDVGWDLLQREAWDLVLLDWWLPRQDGLTLLRRLREANRVTPVLLLTARDQVQFRVLGLD